MRGSARLCCLGSCEVYIAVIRDWRHEEDRTERRGVVSAFTATVYYFRLQLLSWLSFFRSTESTQIRMSAML